MSGNSKNDCITNAPDDETRTSQEGKLRKLRALTQVACLPKTAHA
jgi:hypothetical protein